MKQFKFPHIGMRTTKTAVAVMLSYLIFVPFGLLYNESYPGVLAYVGPTYSCIACIVCMQSSLEQTLQVGLSRFVGVFIGAILGVAMLLLEPLLSHWVGIVLMLGAACVCGIWLCMLFNRPAACGMACILPCVMLISGDVSGIQRYYYAAARVSETVVGVTVPSSSTPCSPPEIHSPRISDRLNSLSARTHQKRTGPRVRRTLQARGLVFHSRSTG